MSDIAYVTQEMWDRAQAALRAALPVIDEQVPRLSTKGTMISLRDQIRAAIVGPTQETLPDVPARDQGETPEEYRRRVALIVGPG